MKTAKIIYWTTTAILSGMMVFSAFEYLTNDQVKNGFVHLGIPGYLRIELAIAKLLGAIALIVPGINLSIKQLAYFGFAITFVSAFVAHTSVGDEFGRAVMPLIFLGILVVSYLYYNKATDLRTT